MISYLKGIVTTVGRTTGRVILTLEVNQIGYDVQITPRLVESLPATGQTTQVFTFLQVRDEVPVLYGFASAAERDLFRQLLSVSGIGPQLAIGLLDKLGLAQLVEAIVTGNTKLLTKAPGVGSKTAERIALELRTKLAQWRQQEGLTLPVPLGVAPAIQEDVEMTLLALGYSESEIMQALDHLSHDPSLSGKDNPEAWIRASIAWLSG